MKHRISILLISAALAVSCSVKEDRTDCPLYVAVKAQTESDCLVSFFAGDGTLLASRFIAAEDMCSGNNRTELRRTDFYVSILKDKWDMAFRGSQVVYCKTGKEAAPVYAFSGRQFEIEDKYSDFLLVEGVLKKQHAVVTVQFKSDTGSDFPYKMKVSSGKNGFDLVTLEGAEGEYSIEPIVDESLRTEFILTRQSNADPILLSLNDEITGLEKTTIDIGRYISKAGYDWKAESLGDIDITVDYSQMTIAIRIADWEDELIEIF